MTTETIYHFTDIEFTHVEGVGWFANIPKVDAEKLADSGVIHPADIFPGSPVTINGHPYKVKSIFYRTIGLGKNARYRLPFSLIISGEPVVD